MKALKTHSSVSQQVSLLQKRGLSIANPKDAEAVLLRVNYYRLSGYLHDFKQPSSGLYIQGLTWERLKRIYDFDRKLTRILLYTLEDIEETLKTRFSYMITSRYPSDSLIYLRPDIYRDYSAYLRFLDSFYQSTDNNSNLPFVKHHKQVYGGMLPLWVAVELLTMGNLHAVYENLITKYQKALAREYRTGVRQLSSWIENLTYTRNHLAHYMRIYNFNFGRTPAKCSQHPRSFTQTHMIFDQICAIANMYSDPDEWVNYVLAELKALIDEYAEDVELCGLGFPENWEQVLR